MRELLPVHGFVLAGGQSSRMGRDKALVPFRGRPMVEIAVEKLRAFCAEVWISGNREDLADFATVVREEPVAAGPIAGLEAGLQVSTQRWAMFLPVDVPRLPAALLRRWAVAVLAREDVGCRLSYLRLGDQRHPALCLLHRDCLRSVTEAIGDHVHKLSVAFDRVQLDLGEGTVWVCDAEVLLAEDLSPEQLPGAAEWAAWFGNVNTPEELALAEGESSGEGGVE